MAAVDKRKAWRQWRPVAGMSAGGDAQPSLQQHQQEVLRLVIGETLRGGGSRHHLASAVAAALRESCTMRRGSELDTHREEGADAIDKLVAPSEARTLSAGLAAQRAVGAATGTPQRSVGMAYRTARDVAPCSARAVRRLARARNALAHPEEVVANLTQELVSGIAGPSVFSLTDASDGERGSVRSLVMEEPAREPGIVDGGSGGDESWAVVLEQRVSLVEARIAAVENAIPLSAAAAAEVAAAAAAAACYRAPGEDCGAAAAAQTSTIGRDEAIAIVSEGSSGDSAGKEEEEDGEVVEGVGDEEQRDHAMLLETRAEDLHDHADERCIPADVGTLIGNVSKFDTDENAVAAALAAAEPVAEAAVGPECDEEAESKPGGTQPGALLDSTGFAGGPQSSFDSAHRDSARRETCHEVTRVDPAIATGVNGDKVLTKLMFANLMADFHTRFNDTVPNLEGDVSGLSALAHQAMEVIDALERAIQRMQPHEQGSSAEVVKDVGEMAAECEKRAFGAIEACAWNARFVAAAEVAKEARRCWSQLLVAAVERKPAQARSSLHLDERDAVPASPRKATQEGKCKGKCRNKRGNKNKGLGATPA